MEKYEAQGGNPASFFVCCPNNAYFGQLVLIVQGIMRQLN